METDGSAEGVDERPIDDIESDEAPPTDWEQYDITVRLEFGGANDVKLELVGRSDPIRGQWKVVESTPGAVSIEIATPAGDSPSDATPSVRRRFELEPSFDDDKLTGFVLREAGVDRMLGSLYFKRPE